jgi:hypothetical protein
MAARLHDECPSGIQVSQTYPYATGTPSATHNSSIRGCEPEKRTRSGFFVIRRCMTVYLQTLSPGQSKTITLLSADSELAGCGKGIGR